MKHDDKKLPDLFAVKKDESNPLWTKYLDWWNRMYGLYAKDLPYQYNYYGRGESGTYTSGFMAATELRFMDEGTVEITLEQWNELNKET